MDPVDLHQLRFQLGSRVAVAWHGFSEPSWVGAIQPGLRVRFTQDFGLIGNLDFGLGGWSDTASGIEQGGVAMIRGQLTPYFNPGGRFYFGPTLVLGHSWYGFTERDEFGFSLGTNRFQRWNAGAGLRIGTFLGRSKRVEGHFEWLQVSEARRHVPFQFERPEFNLGFSVAF